MGDDFSAAHNKSGAGCRSRALYPFFKTVMCKNYPNCKYGDRCNFAHGPDELRKLDETILNAVARPKSPDSDTSSTTASDRHSEAGSSTGGAANFKTRMCKNYEKNGFCKFGDRCNFAHGRDELRRGERSAQRHEQTSPRKEDGKRAYSMACVRLNAGETTRQGWIWGDLVLSTVRLGARGVLGDQTAAGVE